MHDSAGPYADDLPPQRKHERVFAIGAPPHRIWRLLLDEARQGVESGRAAIVRQGGVARTPCSTFAWGAASPSATTTC